jgi:hypothetical protein
MRRFMSIVVAVCFFSFAAFAQKAEVFGGYQYTHLEPSTNINGWNGALTGNINHYLGVTADFSGTYGSGLKYHTYMFGPVVSAGKGSISPFVHALFGGATASGGGISTSGFSMALGGGVDLGSKPLSFRLIQADWLYDRFSGISSSKNFRASSGLVFRF